MWMRRVYALMGLLAWFVAVDRVDAGNLQKGDYTTKGPVIRSIQVWPPVVPE